MSDIRKEVETRYHIRFNDPYDHTVQVSKDIMMACQQARKFFESGDCLNRSVYVVEVKEKVIKSFEK